MPRQRILRAAAPAAARAVAVLTAPGLLRRAPAAVSYTHLTLPTIYSV